MRPHLGAYDAERLSWAWTAADPEADALQARLAALAESGELTFERACEEAGAGQIAAGSVEGRPRLTEAWFC
jgi:hypothetical protein